MGRGRAGWRGRQSRATGGQERNTSREGRFQKGMGSNFKDHRKKKAQHVATGLGKSEVSGDLLKDGLMTGGNGL